MEDMDLGMVIIMGIGVMGLLQLILWVVVVIRHQGSHDLHLTLERTDSMPSNRASS